MPTSLGEIFHSIDPFIPNEEGVKGGVADRVLFVAYPLLIGGTLLIGGGCYLAPQTLNFCLMGGFAATLPLYTLSFAVHAYFIRQKKRLRATSYIPSQPVANNKGMVILKPTEEARKRPKRKRKKRNPSHQKKERKKNQATTAPAVLYRSSEPEEQDIDDADRGSVDDWGPVFTRRTIDEEDEVISDTPDDKEVIPSASVGTLAVGSIAPSSALPLRPITIDLAPWVKSSLPRACRFVVKPLSRVKYTPPRPRVEVPLAVKAPFRPLRPLSPPLDAKEASAGDAVNEDKIQAPHVPKGLLQKFVGWLFQEKKKEDVDPLSDKEKECLAEIKKQNSSLYLSKEFSWARRLASRGEIDTKSDDAELEEEESDAATNPIDTLKKEVHEALYGALEEHVDTCAAGYKKGVIERCLASIMKLKLIEDKSFEVKTALFFDTLALVPFFIRFFIALGDKREAILPWLNKHKNKMFSALQLADSSKSLQGVAELGEGFFEAITQFLAPFNVFLDTKDFAGKAYLMHYIEYALTSLLPLMFNRSIDAVLKDEKKRAILQEACSIKFEKAKTTLTGVKGLSDRFKKSICKYLSRKREEYKLELPKLVRDELFVHHLFPFVAKFLFHPKEASVEAYLEGLMPAKEKMAAVYGAQAFERSVFKGEKGKKSASSPPTADLIEGQKTLNALIAQEKNNLLELETQLLQGVLANNSAVYAPFVKETKGVMATVLKYIQGLIGKEATFGEYLVKSQLLAGAVAHKFSSVEERLALIQLVLTTIVGFADKTNLAKSDKKRLREAIESKFETLSNGILNFDLANEEVDALRLIPLQDLILVMLLIGFAAENFHKMRPFLDKHQGVVSAIIKDCQLEQVQKYESTISWALFFFLKMLKPFNGILNSNFPGKNTAIKGTCETFAATMKSEMLRKKTVKELTAEEESAFDLGIPLAKFLLLGFFGKDKDKQAMKALREKFEHVYQTLYDFDLDPDEMEKIPKILGGKIDKALEILKS